MEMSKFLTARLTNPVAIPHPHRVEYLRAIGSFIGNLGMSGGVKVLLQHVRLLRELGHDALLLTKRIVYDWADMADNAVILREDLSDMPDCDLYVATVASEVSTLYRSKRGTVAHLCQGYEPEESGRGPGESVTERYRATGPFSFLKPAGNNLRFRRRIRRFEAAYALPTVKMAVSRHLADLIEGRYGQRCFLVQNGVDQRVFYSAPNMRAAGHSRPGQGPLHRLHTRRLQRHSRRLEAIRILKDRGCPVELPRVSPGPPSPEETKSPICGPSSDRHKRAGDGCPLQGNRHIRLFFPGG